ncbi:hypothetical protein AB0I54_28450 [Streptomyces sp. NPDC050625]|uniref:hypothetical protein n=1 Tax=Streptomyces sp. NPDC050625 TaxID=3154629 RepID=UPI003415838B
MTAQTSRRLARSAPCDPARLTPALPPAYEAFCALNREGYLDYARVHLPSAQAHQLVRSVLGELAVGWTGIVSHPSPPARAWELMRSRVHTVARIPPVLETCPAQQYDALVLNCRLGYSSMAAASVIGLDASKVRYLVLSAPSERRRAVRHLQPRSAVCQLT